MDGLSLRFVFDRKGEAKNAPEKKALIQIEVREKRTGRKIYISTGIKLLASQYSDKTGFTIKNHPNSLSLKKKAIDTYNKVEAWVFSSQCFCFDHIKLWNKDSDDLRVFVADFIKSVFVQKNTYTKNNKSFLSRLEAFGKIKTFGDFSYKTIEEFDSYLRSEGNNQTTIHRRHATLRSMIELAAKRGIKVENPYNFFSFSKGISRVPVFLTEEEVDRIVKYVPTGSTTNKIQVVRDLFLFQCYTGLAYTDLSGFNRSMVKEDDGSEYIEGTRNKTGVKFVILFLPIAKEIAKKYDYHLPVISNQKYNDYLKLLAHYCGIDKRITTHTARHTFATYMINNGISIEAIPKILGHTNMDQSLAYAKLLDKTALDEMKKLLKVK